MNTGHERTEPHWNTWIDKKNKTTNHEISCELFALGNKWDRLDVRSLTSSLSRLTNLALSSSARRHNQQYPRGSSRLCNHNIIWMMLTNMFAPEVQVLVDGSVLSPEWLSSKTKWSRLPDTTPSKGGKRVRRRCLTCLSPLDSHPYPPLLVPPHPYPALILSSNEISHLTFVEFALLPPLSVLLCCVFFHGVQILGSLPFDTGYLRKWNQVLLSSLFCT